MTAIEYFRSMDYFVEIAESPWSFRIVGHRYARPQDFIDMASLELEEIGFAVEEFQQDGNTILVRDNPDLKVVE